MRPVVVKTAVEGENSAAWMVVTGACPKTTELAARVAPSLSTSTQHPCPQPLPPIRAPSDLSGPSGIAAKDCAKYPYPECY